MRNTHTTHSSLLAGPTSSCCSTGTWPTTEGRPARPSWAICRSAPTALSGRDEAYSRELSDRDEAYSRELSRLREIAGPKLHAAYRELAGLKVLRRLLDTQEGATLKARLRALNTLLNGDD